jgi:hypothetical protein
MKNWKWRTIQVFFVITFFSCAGYPPATKPVEHSQERPLPTTSLGEKPQEKFEGSDLKRPGADAPKEPPVRTSEIPMTAQPPAGQSRDLQSTLAQPSKSPAKPRAASRFTYTDYRTKTLPTRKSKPAPEKSTLAQDEENYVALNFDNADINEVIATIARLIGLKYIADPEIQGQRLNRSKRWRVL